MQAAGHLAGGAEWLQKMKLGATMADPGIIMIGGNVGVIPSTTTSFADAWGLANDEATYSTTQGDAEGLVTLSRRPDLKVKALMSGGAAEGTALTTLVNTAASAGGTTVTDADVGTADMDGGILWCIAGANVGVSRTVTTFTASTSVAVTVPFPRAIAVNDQFLLAPYNYVGTGAAGLDGAIAVQTTTLFTQANAAIASGTGGETVVCDLELNGASDSYVVFWLRLHSLGSATQAS